MLTGCKPKSDQLTGASKRSRGQPLFTYPEGKYPVSMAQGLLYTDKAKPQKEPSILRTEHELRQQGARRRYRDLGLDCLERRS
eukprot:2495283-Pleurochrysis_carterae.AAC.3